MIRSFADKRTAAICADRMPKGFPSDLAKVARRKLRILGRQRGSKILQRIGPVTPGEVLREEFMAPFGLSGRALARELGVPSNRITEIVSGERAITAETAILLGERFRTSAEFWLNLQTAHDLERARRRMHRAAA